MNRRDFFKAACGLLGVAVIPSLAASPGPASGFITIDEVKRAAEILSGNRVKILNDNWFCVIHPDFERDIRGMVAREEWKAAYRKARIELREMGKRLGASGEIGHVESIRFVVSPR